MSDASARDIDRAAELLGGGGVVVYPTETLYGLGVDAGSEPALERLAALKGREAAKPVSILVDSREMLEDWVRDVPSYAERLMTTFWPGALTIALPAKPHVSQWLTGGGGSIGVRISSHLVAQRLVSRFGRALTATSANPSRRDAPAALEEARRYFGSSVDAYLDGGRLSGQGSTVIDASGDRPLLIREGAIAATTIEAAASIELFRG